MKQSRCGLIYVQVVICEILVLKAHGEVSSCLLSFWVCWPTDGQKDILWDEIVKKGKQLNKFKNSSGKFENPQRHN